jgi:hypothetical protein
MEPFSACLDEFMTRSVCSEDDPLSVYCIATRAISVDWSAEIGSWVSIHRTATSSYVELYGEILLQDEIAPPWQTSERWCRFNQRHVE